jgi:hypothetical protein
MAGPASREGAEAASGTPAAGRSAGPAVVSSELLVGAHERAIQHGSECALSLIGNSAWLWW